MNQIKVTQIHLKHIPDIDKSNMHKKKKLPKINIKGYTDTHHAC